MPTVSSPAGWWPPFGEFFVAAMLIFYALEDRSPWYILAFAAACGLGRPTGSYKARGLLESSEPYGQA